MNQAFLFPLIFLVLSTTTAAQVINDFQVTDANSWHKPGSPRIGVWSDGSFVIVWEDHRENEFQNQTLYGNIYCQRYNSNGVAQGKNLRVNDDATQAMVFQLQPDIAISPDGTCIMVWQDGRNGNMDIYGQLYNATGNKTGTNFCVNPVDDIDQFMPSVAVDDSGRFTVVWREEANWQHNLMARQFNAAGEPLGNTFRINEIPGTVESQCRPDIDAAANGEFVIVWTDTRYDSVEIYGQRFTPTSERSGFNFKINDNARSQRSDWQPKPRVGMDAAGNFVVVWQDYRSKRLDAEIYAQIFNTSGAASGLNFRINDIVGLPNENCSLDMASGGHFVVAWQNTRDFIKPPDIYSQLYTPEGKKTGYNTLVNDPGTYTAITPDVQIMNQYLYFSWLDSRFNLPDPIGSWHIFACVDLFPTSISKNSPDANLSLGFNLDHNYPNPFNPRTIIPLFLSVQAEVTLTIINLTGDEIANIYRGSLEAGNHEFNWDINQLSTGTVPSGVYFYRLRIASGIEQTKKMLILK